MVSCRLFPQYIYIIILYIYLSNAYLELRVLCSVEWYIVYLFEGNGQYTYLKSTMTKWLHVQPNTYKLFFSSYDGNHTDIYQMYHCFSMKYNDILRIFHVYAYYELETYYSVWLVICSIAISPHKMALFMVETMEKNKQKHVSREKNQSCS